MQCAASTLPASNLGLQLSWQACAVLQFVRVFGPMLRLAPLKRAELEKALCEPGADRPLHELQWRLLRPGTSPCPEGDVWFEELRKAARKPTMRLEPAVAERLFAVNYYEELEALERLALLLALCDATAPECDAASLTHLDGTADGMRAEAVGVDAHKRKYLWFGDEELLFREVSTFGPMPKPPKPTKRAMRGSSQGHARVLTGAMLALSDKDPYIHKGV
ncbi:hypothetical protein T492DRAFT_841159 [Pavlovales sp. CCMP2436]|nr:hypothetical protein T492DRAFT_841159 [Pavlovales sp. CCMP2436]